MNNQPAGTVVKQKKPASTVVKQKRYIDRRLTELFILYGDLKLGESNKNNKDMSIFLF